MTTSKLVVPSCSLKSVVVEFVVKEKNFVVLSWVVMKLDCCC